MQYHHAILAGPLWPTNDMTTWLRMLHLEAGIPWSIRTQAAMGFCCTRSSQACLWYLEHGELKRAEWIFAKFQWIDFFAQWNLYHERLWNQVLLFKPPTHATSKHLRATVRHCTSLLNSPCKIYRGFHDHGWKRLDRYLRGTQHKVRNISLKHLSWGLILNTCIQNSVEQLRPYTYEQ